jgi:hypothetical protein
VVDIVETDDPKEVLRASMIVRSHGRWDTGTLAATPWKTFLTGIGQQATLDGLRGSAARSLEMPPTTEQPARAGPARAVRRRRRWLLAAAASAVAILGLELAARAWAAATGRERGLGFDAVLGWHMLPGIEKTGNGWGAREPGRTNSRGWRDVERSLDKPPGVRRIIALGDSFTFGQGVDLHERFTELVAERLGCEVVNLGACAFGTDQEVLAFEHEGSAYAPDVVLLTVFLGNDLDDIRNDRQAGWSKPWFRLRAGALELVPAERGWRMELRTRSYLAEALFQRLERGESSSRRAPDWRTGDTLPLFEALVVRLQHGVGKGGARLLVAVVHENSGRRDLPRSPTAQAVLSCLQRNGIASVDTYDAFAGCELPWSELFQADLHWTAAGHRVAAAAIAADLERRGWLQ